MGLEDIFRAYDVRGEVPEELSADVAVKVGKAFGTLLQEKGEDTAVVGMDVRESSPELKDALVEGLASTGVEVTDAGIAPYGAVLFHGRESATHSAYVTASHLPQGFNGIKFGSSDGTGYTEEENSEVRDAFFAGDFSEGRGEVREVEILETYTEYLLERVEMQDLRVLMDPGNGAASVAAPDLFWEAGATLEVMNGDEDGSFPNRSSDVTEDTLGELSERVAEGGFDVGIAYDGDADRVAVVDDEGRLMSAEEAAYVALEQLLPEDGGPVVANVECSRLIEDVAEEYGSEVFRMRVGHSYLFREVMDRDACLGVEKSRHIGISRVLPLNDGIAASLYLASVVSGMNGRLSEKVDSIPVYERERIPFKVEDSRKFDVVEELAGELEEEYGDTNRKDGIRVELGNGWILVRASNTSPKIRLTVEAETEEDFAKLKGRFAGRVEKAITDA